jgi:peptidoglycan/LPS O-acetylase OafA/YrhL
LTEPGNFGLGDDTLKLAPFNPATQPEHHRFHFLDGLRGLAAIVVVTLHPPPELRQLSTRSGHLAVDFFFCLSGFVIAFSYQKRLSESLSQLDFAAARFIRLYPMAFLGTLLGVVGMALNPWSPNIVHMVVPVSRGIRQVLLSLMLVPAISLVHPKDLLYPVDPPMWSLFLELAANLFFAALVRFRLASTSVLLPLWLLSLALLEHQRRLNGTFDYGYTVDGLLEGFGRVLFSFFAGVIVCRIYQRVQLPRIHGTRAILAALAISAVFLGVLCNSSQFTAREAVGFIEIGLVFPAIVYVGANLFLPARATEACSFLGNISYPLYLIQVPLMWPLYCDSVRHYFVHNPMALPFLIVYLASIVLLAWWTSRIYDAPVRKWLTRTYRSFWERRQLLTPAASG